MSQLKSENFDALRLEGVEILGAYQSHRSQCSGPQASAVSIVGVRISINVGYDIDEQTPAVVRIVLKTRYQTICKTAN